jgi:DNA-binding NarL/FixJ family response regulator
MKPEHRELLDELRPARRVLVVDDHPSFRRCARTMLTVEGFDVVGEAATGAEALEQAAELAPELVLLDVQLPDADGFEVASRLLARDPELGIVLVSGRDATAYGDRIESSGARAFIFKADLSGAAIERLIR